MTRTREFRRKELWKAKKRCINRLWWMLPEHLSSFYRNRKPCSCAMCGNPRKHWDEKTRQEERAELEDNEQREELD